MFRESNMRFVSSPFGINGIECYKGNVSLTKPRIINYTPLQNTLVCKGAPSVRQLSLQEKKCGNNSTENQIVIASLHQKGDLILWDADTFDVIGCCKHYGCSLVQCIVTRTYLFVRVENDGYGYSDAETRVYVWHAESLKLFRQLNAHSARVTSMVVNDENDAQFATAGTDHVVHIWDLNKDVVSSVKSIATAGIPYVRMYFKGMVIGGFLNTSLAVWSPERDAAVHALKDGGDILRVLRWLDDPKENCAITRHYDSSQQRFFTLLAGYGDGWVKGWTMDVQANMLPSLDWGLKVHKAHVTDLCGDNNVVLSWSALDGAFFLLPKYSATVQIVSSGVYTALLEPHSKKAIIGLEDGSLRIFSYEKFFSSNDEPIFLFSFQPHVSAITGMFLQLRRDLEWDRLICSAADGTIAFMDYGNWRGGKLLEGVLALSVESVEKGGPILIPKGKDSGGICAIDSVNFLPCSQEVNVMKKRTVSALRWFNNTKKLAVGTRDGMLALFEGTIAGDSTPSFLLLNDRFIHEYFVLDFVPSLPDGYFALVILQKNARIFDRAFLIIDIKNVDLNFPLQCITPKILAHGILFMFSGQVTDDYILILQLQDGTIDQYAGNYASKVAPSLVRTLLRPLYINTFELEEIGWTKSINFFLNSLPTEGRDLEIKMICADGSRLKQLIFNTKPNGSLISREFDQITQTSFAEQPTKNISYLQPIQHCGLELAVLRKSSSSVDIIAADGEYLYRIGYDGSVFDFKKKGLCNNRLRNFLHNNDVMNFFPFASSTAYCVTAYYMAIGYSDGLVQLFDTTQRIVFARFTAFHRLVSNIWAFSNVVVSATPDGNSRADRLFRRVMYDKPESSCLSANTKNKCMHASPNTSIITA